MSLLPCPSHNSGSQGLHIFPVSLAPPKIIFSKKFTVKTYIQQAIFILPTKNYQIFWPLWGLKRFQKIPQFRDSLSKTSKFNLMYQLSQQSLTYYLPLRHKKHYENGCLYLQHPVVKEPLNQPFIFTNVVKLR